MKKKILVFIAIILSLFIFFIGSNYLIDKVSVNNTYMIGETNLKIPVFVYHDIVKDESEVEYDYMQTYLSRFEDQIEWLEDSGFDFITYEELKEYEEGKRALKTNSCIVTFDDGYEGVYQNAYPIVKKHNIPITIFVINEKVGNPGYFNWEKAKEMQDSGLVTIASHSINHPEFTKLSTEEAVKNVNNSYKEIEEHLGKQKVKVFTYPYGLYTEEQSKRLGENGYIQNLTDNKINKSKKMNLRKVHRCYPLNDSPLKMKCKMFYRTIRYD